MTKTLTSFIQFQHWHLDQYYIYIDDIESVIRRTTYLTGRETGSFHLQYYIIFERL
jgi:hypothetical protein